MACNDLQNPLQHDGSSQEQRRLPALDPAYARVDERDTKDWIDFASRFAVYLHHYSGSDVPTGNWEPFFNSDIAAVLGSLAVQNIDSYRLSIQERLAFLRDDANDDDLPGMEATLGGLSAAMLTLSLGLDAYIIKLPPDHRSNVLLQQLISQRLKPALAQILSWYKGGKSNRRSDGTEDNELIIIRDRDFLDWTVLRQPVRDVRELINGRTLSAAWIGGAGSLKAWYQSLPADNSIYGEESAAPVLRIRHAANHNLFTGTLDQFLAAYAGLIRDAETALTDSLENYNLHPPHYTLFLTFLQLFRLAQDELNTIGDRHLRHYYEDILRLRPKAAQPNRAFVLAELQKGVESAALPAGSRFRAGKDSAGAEILYALDNETVFNQAKIEALMAVYRAAGAPGSGKPSPDNIPPVNNEGRLFAAPVMNSADGLGKELDSPAGEWHPFANKSFIDGQLSAINMPRADIGIAIASPYLWMAEGDREIRIQIETSNIPASFPPTLHFDAHITTAKEWTPLTMNCTVTQSAKGSSDSINLQVLLDGGFPPITPYAAAVHGGNYQSTSPILRLILHNEDGLKYEYDLIKDLRIQDIRLNVYAGIDPATGKASRTGVRNLFLSNELGPVDPAKPFNPFGLMPGTGSSFVIGSEEFFKKPGAEFQLNLKWLDLPASASDVDYDGIAAEADKAPSVRLEALARSGWQEIDDDLDFWEIKKLSGRGVRGGRVVTITRTFNAFNDTNLFPTQPQTLGIGTNNGDKAAYLPFGDTYLPYAVAARNGFMRIVLEAGFGYQDYQKAFAEYLVSLGRTGSGTPPGKAPYVPKMESVSLHYQASASFDPGATVNAAGIELYHVYPFGTSRQSAATAATGMMLAPQFTRGAGNDAKKDSAEFYIGLSKLRPRQGLNLLFAVQEGSADPLLIKPVPHLSWHYLSGNTWKSFLPQAIADNTAQWIRTGIISFSIPEDADAAHTMLADGLIWIRASVTSATGAVCKLLGIHPNAATATFSDNGNVPEAMNAPLPPGTISKLRQPVAAFKKFSQPYSGFGGRAAEIQPAYRTRVSERLRHKDRAITIWDYEHLVLEAFPALHRVKCLSHTSFEQLSDGTRRINEMAPGHVTVISVPRLEEIRTTNPLRPYTSERILEEIRSFLAARFSAHVRLHVAHPIFEEVALDFRLRLMPGFDDFTFYRKRLGEEITAWLTPWVTGGGAGPAFGGRISKSALINFIEERSYVDYVTDVRMYHRTEAAPAAVVDTDEICPATALSILVSVPASKHTITEIPQAAAALRAVVCIDPYQTSTQG